MVDFVFMDGFAINSNFQNFESTDVFYCGNVSRIGMRIHINRMDDLLYYIGMLNCINHNHSNSSMQ